MTIRFEKEDSYSSTFGPDTISGEHRPLDAGITKLAGLVSFYYKYDIARRIVDVVPEEMVAPGFQVEGLDDDKELRSVWTGLRIDQSIVDALAWSRLFGKSAILAMVDDGGTLQSPVREGAKLESVRVYDKTQIEVDRYETNQRNSRYGLPKIYVIKPDSGREFKVHHSRIHVIDGNRMPPSSQEKIDSSGVSVLSPDLINAIRDYSECHRLATEILRRKQQAVWKAKNLALLCDDREGEYAARLRLAQVTDNSGVGKPIGIDADDEDYNVLNSDLGGVPEFLSMKMDRIVELSGIHEIILRNKNTGGVSASQNTALQTFYKLIDRKRKDDLHPILEFLLPFVIDEKEWTVVFEPISLPSDAEKAKILVDVAGAIDKFIANQSLDVEEARDTLEAMKLGLKLKDNPGPLPTREEAKAARDMALNPDGNNSENDDQNGENDEGAQGNS